MDEQLTDEFGALAAVAGPPRVDVSTIARRVKRRRAARAGTLALAVVLTGVGGVAVAASVTSRTGQPSNGVVAGEAPPTPSADPSPVAGPRWVKVVCGADVSTAALGASRAADGTIHIDDRTFVNGELKFRVSITGKPGGLDNLKRVLTRNGKVVAMPGESVAGPSNDKTPPPGMRTESARVKLRWAPCAGVTQADIAADPAGYELLIFMDVKGAERDRLVTELANLTERERKDWDDTYAAVPGVWATQRLR